MQDTMISRILRVSPDQSELYKRNKSRIFFAVEGESLIDTILNQRHRPIEDYVETAERAIAQAGMDGTHGEIRALDGTFITGAGIAFLMTSSWLKDDEGNVFDMFISLDPEFEMSGEPNVKIVSAAQINNAIEGENPLILTCDIDDLFDDSDMDIDDNRMSDEMKPEGHQTTASDNTNTQARTEQASTSSASNQHSDMSSNDAEIAARRSTNTGGEVPAGRGDDQDRQPGGQGRVKSEEDGRLKENRDAGTHIDGTTDASNENAQVGGQGRVTDPNDGRLKANIDAGVKVGNGDSQSTAEQREPAMARQGQDESSTPRRGRVTSAHDRRLKRNRSR